MRPQQAQKLVRKRRVCSSQPTVACLSHLPNQQLLLDAVVAAHGVVDAMVARCVSRRFALGSQRRNILVSRLAETCRLSTVDCNAVG